MLPVVLVFFFGNEKLKPGDESKLERIIGMGTVLTVVIAVLIYGIFALRLWSYICLLNGTKTVSLFILNVPQLNNLLINLIHFLNSVIIRKL